MSDTVPADQHLGLAYIKAAYSSELSGNDEGPQPSAGSSGPATLRVRGGCGTVSFQRGHVALKERCFGVFEDVGNATIAARQVGMNRDSA